MTTLSANFTSRWYSTQSSLSLLKVMKVLVNVSLRVHFKFSDEHLSPIYMGVPLWIQV